MRESHRILFFTFCENPVFVDLMAASYQYFHTVFRVSDGRGYYVRRVQLTSQCTQPSGVRVACTAHYQRMTDGHAAYNEVPL